MADAFGSATRSGGDPAPGARRTAFVLAGGGTKGAFEAGALRYLVEERSITPDIVTATSAGAIAAAVLAQGRTLEEFVKCTEDLRDDLLAMTHTELLFGKQPWVVALEGTPLGATIDSYINEQSRPPVPGDPLVYESAAGGKGTSVGGTATNPTPRRRRDLLAGALRVLPRIRRTRRGLRHDATSLLTLDPLALALRAGSPSGIKRIDVARIRRPGLQLRLAVTALGAGVLRYVTEDGSIVERDAHTPVEGAGGGPIDLIDGVLASSSVPLIFPPRAMADDIYVDGGVVQNIPVAPAVALGADRIFAILAVPVAQPRDDRDFTRLNMFEILLRSMAAVAFVENQREDLATPLAEGSTLTVIDPLVDVVGPFEVAQGLMLIDMDYGWMRAADVLADVEPAVRARALATTEAIVTARTRAWHVEEPVWATGRATTSELRILSGLKREVREAVLERKELGLPMPGDAEPWWGGYERHAPAPPDRLPVWPDDERR